MKEVRIISRDELKQYLMRHKYKNDKIKFFIDDARDYSFIKNYFWSWLSILCSGFRANSILWVFLV